MAVVQKFDQDEDDTENQPQANQSGAPIPLGGSAQGPASSEDSQSRSNSYNAQAPTSSGRFTNLQSYLDANKGYNAQNGGLAGQIQSNLSGQAKGIQDSAGTAAQQFQSGADANRIKYNEDAVNSAVSNPYAYLNPTTQPITGNVKPGIKQAGQEGSGGYIDPNAYQQLTGTGSTSSMPLSGGNDMYGGYGGPNPLNNSLGGLSNSPGALLTGTSGPATPLDASQIGAGSPINQTTASNPVSLGNPLDAFARMRDAVYTPTDTNLQPYINQASQFQSTANLAGSEPGRYALLKNLYGGNGYNTGQQKLDNLLLQGNQDQLKVLNGVPTLGADLNTNINNQLNQENVLNTQYGQEAADTQNKTRDALAAAVDPMVQQTLTGAKNAQDSYNNAQTAAQKELAAGIIPQSDASKFGLSSSTPLFGMSPQQLSSYLTLGSNTATPQNTMTQDQYNNFQALSKLAGNTLGGSDPTSALSKAGAELQPYLGTSQVGQFAQQNPFTFNSGQFNNDVAAGRNAYINAATQANSQIQKHVGNISGYEPGVSTTELLGNLAALQNYQQKYPGSNAPVASDIQALQNIIKSYGINPANVTAGTSDPWSGMNGLTLGEQSPSTPSIEGNKQSPGTQLAKPGSTINPKSFKGSGRGGVNYIEQP